MCFRAKSSDDRVDRNGVCVSINAHEDQSRFVQAEVLSGCDESILATPHGGIRLPASPDNLVGSY
jgi:hypothetical protein